MSELEVFKDIPGYAGRYSISDAGRVYSYLSNKFLSLQRHRDGHLHVALYGLGQVKQFWVHRLVLASFVGPCPEGQEVRHLNGHASDNRLENLEYGTRMQNIHDAISHGTHNGAARHCKKGHPYDNKNTYIRKSGKRQCRQCGREYSRRTR